MKLLFLRGQIPQDRNPKEIMHKSIDKEDDMWTNLAYHLGDERCEVLYWGGKRKVKYSDKCMIRWVNSFKHYEPKFKPDVIFARGGFKEFIPILKRYPKAFKIYSGAGRRFVPEGFKKYNLILADSPEQLKKLKSKLPDSTSALWTKPACPIFKLIDTKKEFDICYVGDARYPFRAKIKGIKFAYKVPKEFSMLHLGWNGKYKPPKNVKVKRVVRNKMPKQISRCKVLIVPYSNYDSGPRIVPEALACGVPVVVLDGANISNYYFPKVYGEVFAPCGIKYLDKDAFWTYVKQYVKTYSKNTDLVVSHFYMKYLSMEKAVEHLKGLIDGK